MLPPSVLLNGLVSQEAMEAHVELLKGVVLGKRCWEGSQGTITCLLRLSHRLCVEIIYRIANGCNGHIGWDSNIHLGLAAH